MAAISSERVFTTLEDLTSIQSHSGWRGSATTSEKEALVVIGHDRDPLESKEKIGQVPSLLKRTFVDFFQPKFDRDALGCDHLLHLSRSFSTM